LLGKWWVKTNVLTHISQVYAGLLFLWSFWKMLNDLTDLLKLFPPIYTLYFLYKLANIVYRANNIQFF
jgi:hypothetical protein